MVAMEPDTDDNRIKVQDSTTPPTIPIFSNDFPELQLRNKSFVAELEVLRLSNENLESKLMKREEEFIQVQQQKEDALTKVAKERDSLRNEILKVECLLRERERERRNQETGLGTEGREG
ncbi:putative protein-like [Abeliophyllum distichum]|uniref:Uncharacterized protein n=1 Tax=Abeliophyllum distichum TaxID=126358 RepID=A0ABD1VXX4_9LAMI